MGQESYLEIGSRSLIGAYAVLGLLCDPLAVTPVASVLRIRERTATDEFSNICATAGKIGCSGKRLHPAAEE
jgi:hypothetical protein